MPCTDRQGPKFSSASQGAAEATIKSCRNQYKTIQSVFEEETALDITTEDLVSPWMVRHAAWIIGRFRRQPDGQSAYFKLNGVEYSGKVAGMIGETVLFRDNSPAALANKARSP